MIKYANIALSGPLRKSFTYKVPQSIDTLLPGQRVLVPFGNMKKVGFYLGKSTFTPGIRYKNIIQTLDNQSYFPDDLFKLCLWIADYYFANPADCLLSALPSYFKKKKSSQYFWTTAPCDIPKSVLRYYKPGYKLSSLVIKDIHLCQKNLFKKLLHEKTIIEQWLDEPHDRKTRISGYKIESIEAWNIYFHERQFQAEIFDGIKPRVELITNGWTDYQLKKAVENLVLIPIKDDDAVVPLDFIKPKENLEQIKLTENQQRVIEKLLQKISTGFSTTLLHGVTGSGKTIVYCYLCREILKTQKTALILTPEIALTSTTLAYFRGFFGDKVTVIHSAMTEKERLESWNGIRNGKYKIVVGPRSALFAPIQNLGLIIVDEEHDGSYKQDEPAPRFHGRDSAIMRAKINNIPVLLGSASPSVESYQNAVKGRYTLLELTERPGNAVLPVVQVVDMRTDRLRGDLPYISYTLKKQVEKKFQNDEQVILFLNRRGHSPQMKCMECGHIPECPNCKLRLTYHKKGNKLTCHYCGYIIAVIENCEKCTSADFYFMGVGTQKVEENIPRLFNGARPIRMDSDSADGRKKAYEILTHFSEKKSNLLLGTQMVTKGLDMPGVTLVGVLSADASLDMPDFRASEKAFARLLQVSGRSGRAEKAGEVIIQTFNPENEVIQDAAAQDYAGFFSRVIKEREQLWYPPFSRIVNFTLSSEKENLLEKEILLFREKLNHKIKTHNLKVQLLGPAPCPIYYLRNRYRRHLFIKTNQVIRFIKMLSEWEDIEARFKLPATIRINVDVDPDDMM